VSKTWEHYHHAARNHEKAAYHFNEAAKYNRAEEHEKESHHAYLAHGHGQLAVHHDVEAAKFHAEHCTTLGTPASAQAAEEKSAA
jgi:ribulose-5-phosphate 4-epimerase/fuculose-1-phosphate aldolase